MKGLQAKPLEAESFASARRRGFLSYKDLTSYSNMLLERTTCQQRYKLLYFYL